MSTPKIKEAIQSIDPFNIAMLAFLSLLIIWLVQPVLFLFVLIPKGYDEGWNAFVAMRAMGELPLYPEDQTLHTNNYPPISFYVVGALGSMVGDNIFAGRIISLISFFIIAGQIIVVLRLLGCGWSVATFAGLIFVGAFMGFYDPYIGLNDPQMLGHAVMLTGLTVLLAKPSSRGHIIIAAVLMVLAGLIKHNLLALPLAITAWLLLRDRSALIVWLLTSSIVVAAALLLLWVAYGGAIFDNILSSRVYSLSRMLIWTKRSLEKLQIPLTASLLLIVAQPLDPRNQLIGLYVGSSMVVAVVFAGGAGSDYSLFLDLLIALCLGSGLLLHQVDRWIVIERVSASGVRAAVAAAFILGIGLTLPGDRLLLGLSGVREAETRTQEDLAFLAGFDGRVMCETLALCYWAGKALEVDTFNARQGFLTRGHNEQALLDLVAARDFDVIQLTRSDPDRDDERTSRAFMETLYRNYELARTSPNGYFFTPLASPAFSGHTPQPTERIAQPGGCLAQGRCATLALDQSATAC
jgi:hypothetical protein